VRAEPPWITGLPVAWTSTDAGVDEQGAQHGHDDNIFIELKVALTQL
jgi:hypothetical protein